MPRTAATWTTAMLAGTSDNPHAAGFTSTGAGAGVATPPVGARRSDPFRLVLREGLTLATVGTGIGLLGAAGLTRYLASLLYGVGAEDPVTFVAAPLLLAGIALVAVLVPAWRASRVDPAVALRAE